MGSIVFTVYNSSSWWHNQRTLPQQHNNMMGNCNISQGGISLGISRVQSLKNEIHTLISQCELFHPPITWGFSFFFFMVRWFFVYFTCTRGSGTSYRKSSLETQMHVDHCRKFVFKYKYQNWLWLMLHRNTSLKRYCSINNIINVIIPSQIVYWGLILW